VDKDPPEIGTRKSVADTKCLRASENVEMPLWPLLDARAPAAIHTTALGTVTAFTLNG
jgi:hypothetical protein